MVFTRVVVKNTRNIQSLEFFPAPGLNLISGANGVGKTALLEAVHLLVRGRSFRTPAADSLIRHNEGSLLIRGTIESNSEPVDLAVQKHPKLPIQMKFKGEAVKQLSHVARQIPLQVIEPTVANLVFGTPAARREWLDWGVFHQQPKFLEAVRRWRRSLDQRNAALKIGDGEMARAFNETLGKHGDRVTEYRQAYMTELEPFIDSCLAQLDKSFGLALSLARGYTQPNLSEDLEKSLERDLQMRATQLGPQRADVQIRLKDNDTIPNEGSRALSRGQGKIAAYVMKIAESELLKDQRINTIYLIDDIDSELDHAHQSKLVDLLLATSAQVFATTVTRPSQIPYLEKLKNNLCGLFELQKDTSQLVEPIRSD